MISLIVKRHFTGVLLSIHFSANYQNG